MPEQKLKLDYWCGNGRQLPSDVPKLLQAWRLDPSEAIGSECVRRIGDGLPTWEMTCLHVPLFARAAPRKRAADYFERRYAWLRRLLDTFPGAILEYGEKPEENELAGGWKRVCPNCYQIPPEAKDGGARLQQYLSYGQWTIYRAKCPLGAPLGELAAAAGSVHRTGSNWLDLWQRYRVEFALCSEVDDDPWHFTFNETALADAASSRERSEIG